MKAVTIRLTDEEMALVQEFAAEERRTTADAIRTSFFEMLEDRYDLKDLRAAKAKHKQNPITHSHEDVMREFGLA